MKHIYFFFILFFLSQLITAQTYTQKIDEKLQLLDKSEITTHILYDRVFPLANLLEFNRTSIDTSHVHHFYQAYSELQRADYNNRWAGVENLKNDVEAQTNAIPIGILNVDFEYLDEEAIIDDLLDIQVPDSLLVDIANRSRSPYIKENALVVSPMIMDTESLTVNFITGSNFTFQAANFSISSLQGDFDNGQGYQTIPLAGSKSVTFSNTGIYNIKFKITLSNNNIKYTYAKLRVSDEPNIVKIKELAKSQSIIDFCHDNTNPVMEITATIGFQGYNEDEAYAGTGTFAVYKGGSSFDKPIIVLDGFDPFEGNEDLGKDVADIYFEFLKYDLSSNLGNDLKTQGYDIIPLNFEKREASDGTIINGGTDYIERNAMVLVELIKGLNDSSCWPAKKNIKIIGFSMGGLVARYALRYMEMNNIPHNTDLFISVDSPHKGAVVPMGLQQTGDFLEDIRQYDTADQVLKSPAAKQMLKHHYLSGSETPAGAPGFHDRFYNTLNTMGFPQETRNIAVVNGVATGIPTNSPNETFCTADADASIILIIGVGADMRLKFSPDRGETKEVARFRFKIKFLSFDFPVWSRTEYVITPNDTGSYENSPGGYFDAGIFIDQFLGGEMYYSSFYLTTIFLSRMKANLNTDKFSFIPVKSALAYSGGNADLYEDFSTRNLVCTGETPFDSYYTAQGNNQSHTSLNSSSVAYIIDEITGTERMPNVLAEDSQLNGPEVICGANMVYNIAECGANVDNWTVSPNLQILNQSNSYVTVKAINANSDDGAYVQANFTGSSSVRKDVSIGKPTFNVVLDPTVSNTSARAVITGKNSEISNQGITDSNIEVVSSSGYATVSLERYDNKFEVVGQGTTNTWSKLIKFTATNSCGIVETTFTLTPPPPAPCYNVYTFESTATNIYSIVPPDDPCGDNLTTSTTNVSLTTEGYIAQTTLENKAFTIFVYDFSGILLMKTDEKEVDLNGYKDGIYILKAEIDGKTYTKKVLKN